MRAFVSSVLIKSPLAWSRSRKILISSLISAIFALKVAVLVSKSPITPSFSSSYFLSFSTFNYAFLLSCSSCWSVLYLSVLITKRSSSRSFLSFSSALYFAVTLFFSSIFSFSDFLHASPLVRCSFLSLLISRFKTISSWVRDATSELEFPVAVDAYCLALHWTQSELF